MKKIIARTLIGMWIMGIFSPMAYSQPKEDLIKKEAKAEVAADSDRYIIGSEDVLYIHVWKEEALSKTITVRIDGKISLPLIEEIQAAGLTPLQLKDVLTQRFNEFVDVPNVSVMVMEANSFKVFISGQIKKPGVYRLRNETSLIQIISLAEGFTEWANQKEIIIIRKEKDHEKRISVNYKKIISGEDLGSNILLKSGDTIIIP
jgi:polysaccharide biosynthesis/export protein